MRYLISSISVRAIFLILNDIEIVLVGWIRLKM